MAKGAEFTHTQTVTAGNDMFPTRHAILNRKSGKAKLRGVVVEAHHDDIAMSRLTAELSSRDVEMRVVTLTDSSARDIPGYTQDSLVDTRWNEGKRHGKKLGATRLDRIELPDGRLAEHKESAIRFLGPMSLIADFIIAPHPYDEHPDHVAAHEVSLEVAGHEVPVYAMDRITGYARNNNDLLVPARYVPLSRERAAQEQDGYLLNESQWRSIPDEEKVDVDHVLKMTERRGSQIGLEHAAVIFGPLNTQQDPLGEILPFKMVA